MKQAPSSIPQLKKKGGVKEKVQIATKFEITYVRAACEASLKRLDIDCIDLYYAHRTDNRVPIEVTMGELKKLVEKGKVKYLGLSEASASTIRSAHVVHLVIAVQIEWSPWSRDTEEEIIPTCRELGIGIVAYSPLGRGFLATSPKLMENLTMGDYRKNLPRMQAENLETNKLIYEKISKIAVSKGYTPAQLALAWVHHQGDSVSPIPGTTKIENLNANIEALIVRLSPEEMSQLSTLADAVDGDRYHPTIITWKDANMPLLSSWKVET